MGGAMNDDGHFIDDPLMVVNTKPDFSGLGIPTEHHPGEPLTLQYLIGDIPDWIKILPKDWEGETIRAHIKIAASNQAVANPKFDLAGYVSTKFLLALGTIKRKKGKKELCLKKDFRAIIDSIRDPEKTYIYFHIEYAK